MKLKILSEGTGATTKVVNAETGEEVENVLGLEISMDAFNLEAAILIRDPNLSINDIEVQEIRQGDPTGYDGTAVNPDNK